MDNELTFGQWLKRRRRGLGLTQRTLGQQAGYSSETLRKVEADELRPSVQMAERLATALQIDASERARFVSFARDDPASDDHHLSTQTVVLQPAAAPPPPRRHNLPAALTNFIGRQNEVAAVQALLEARRLVTITGPGGMGKSRLSLAVASGLVEAFTGGVWVVALAALSDPKHVAPAVAQVLGLSAGASQPVEAALLEYLRRRSLLLVLDNCEHLIETCATLGQAWLHASPALRLLATSREALGIDGEALYVIPALSLPQDHQSGPAAELLSYEAVQLFSDRAITALPSFSVTAENAPAVAQVCQHLEGMPLAIELAAARVRVLRVDQIAARLQDGFGLLAGGSRTGLPRHQTLKATIDWSYGLLPDGERMVLRRAAVFAGGWTLDAAEAVCGGERAPTAAMLDLLTGLVRKSMVVAEREPGREVRFRLLETIGEYARDRLREAGERAATQARHAEFFTRAAEVAEAHVYQSDQARWLVWFRAELGNLRAALDWTLERRGDAALGVRLATGLFRYWVVHGYVSEGARWIEQAYAADGPPQADRTPEAARRRGRLCSRGAYVIMCAGNTPRAVELSEEGLRLNDAFGPLDDKAQAMVQMAWATWAANDPARAAELFAEAITRAQAAQHRWYEAVAHFQLGGIELDAGHYDEAEIHWQACLVICREQGEALGVADTLGKLGWVAVVRGRYAEARELFQAQISGYRTLGVGQNLAQALAAIGDLAAAIGDNAQARRYIEEALVLFQEQAEANSIAYGLSALAHLARREGDFDGAEALLDQSLALCDTRDSGHQYRLGINRRARAAIARERGHPAQAVALCRESLVLVSAAAWDQTGIAYTLNEMGLALSTAGEWAKAARLLAAGQARRHHVGHALTPIDQADTDRALAAIRAALGEEGLAAAWAAGEALTLEQAVAEALEA